MYFWNGIVCPTCLMGQLLIFKCNSLWSHQKSLITSWLMAINIKILKAIFILIINTLAVWKGFVNVIAASIFTTISASHNLITSAWGVTVTYQLAIYSKESWIAWFEQIQFHHWFTRVVHTCNDLITASDLNNSNNSAYMDVINTALNSGSDWITLSTTLKALNFWSWFGEMFKVDDNLTEISSLGLKFYILGLKYYVMWSKNSRFKPKTFWDW